MSRLEDELLGMVALLRDLDAQVATLTAHMAGAETTIKDIYRRIAELERNK